MQSFHSCLALGWWWCLHRFLCLFFEYVFVDVLFLFFWWGLRLYVCSSFSKISNVLNTFFVLFCWCAPDRWKGFIHTLGKLGAITSFINPSSSSFSHPIIGNRELIFLILLIEFLTFSFLVLLVFFRYLICLRTGSLSKVSLINCWTCFFQVTKVFGAGLSLNIAIQVSLAFPFKQSIKFSWTCAMCISYRTS